MCTGTGCLFSAALDIRAALGINIEGNCDYCSFSLAAPGIKTGPAWMRVEEDRAVHLGENCFMEFSILESTGTKQKGKAKKESSPSQPLQSAQSSRNSHENLSWL